MKISKILTYVLGAMALTLGISTLIPAPADALACFPCDVHLTDGIWGHGASCSAARSDFYAQAAAKPGQICNSQYYGTCGPTPTSRITADCFINSQGTIQVDGWVQYSCRSILDPCVINPFGPNSP